MATRKISNETRLYAVSNGFNFMARVMVVNAPLYQVVQNGTYTPNWETSATKPYFFAHLNRDDNGMVMVPMTTDLYYNDVKIAFDAAGISTTGAMAGVFKKSLRTVSIGGKSYPNMITFEIMKNLASESNYDNDTIKLAGTVESMGKSFSFDGITEQVVIVESTGAADMLYIDGDTEVTTASPTAHLVAHPLIDGITPANLSGLLPKWFKVTGTNDTLVATGVWEIDVTAASIDGTATYRCDVYTADGSMLKASDYRNVYDYTDPYRLALYVDGIEGEQIREGETAVYTAKVIKDDGTELAGAQIEFNVLDNSGTPVSALSGIKNTISVNYENMANYNGGLQIYVSTTV